MRLEIISVLKQHFEAHILKHKMNVDIMLSNPMALHDHTDLMDAIEKEVALMAEYQDKLEIMENYFKE
jgi:hypothetical protein